MTDSKPWWTSKTVWSGLITVAASAIGVFFSVKVGVRDVDQLSGYAAAIGSAATAIVTAISGIMSVYGRVVAKERIE